MITPLHPQKLKAPYSLHFEKQKLRSFPNKFARAAYLLKIRWLHSSPKIQDAHCLQPA